MLYILTLTEHDRGYGSVRCHSLPFESLYILVGYMMEVERYKSLSKIEIEVIGYEYEDYDRDEFNRKIEINI